MKFHVLRASEVWGYDDVEAGDTDRRDDDGGDTYTFRQLVDLLEAHPNASQWPVMDPARLWFTSDDDEDYATGDRTVYSVHLRDASPRAVRYWIKAARMARVIR